jgi:hypothetical protein
MNLPKLRLPKVGEWLSTRPLLTQMTYQVMLGEGAAIFLVIYGVGQFKSIYPQAAYLLGPQLSVAIGAVPGLIYYVAYFIWRNRSRDTAVGLTHFNVNLQWNINRNIDELFSSPKPSIVKENHDAGVNFFKVRCTTPRVDPETGEKFRNILLVTRRPFSEAFMPSGGGIVSHGGLLFGGPVVKSTWTYATGYTSIDPDLDGDAIEEGYRIFIDAWNVYDGADLQRFQGLSPVVKNGYDDKTIIDAMKAEERGKTLTLQLQLADKDAQITQLEEEIDHSVVKGAAQAGKFMKNERIMEEPPSIINRIELKHVVAALGLLLAYWLIQQWLSRGGA